MPQVLRGIRTGTHSNSWWWWVCWWCAAGRKRGQEEESGGRSWSGSRELRSGLWILGSGVKNGEGGGGRCRRDTAKWSTGCGWQEGGSVSEGPQPSLLESGRIIVYCHRKGRGGRFWALFWVLSWGASHLAGLWTLRAWSSKRLFSAVPRTSKDRHAFTVALVNA